MARKRYGFDEARIAHFLKEGRGQGRGVEASTDCEVKDMMTRQLIAVP